MIVELNVPYEEKDIVKKLGAKWNIDKKVWFVENVPNLHKFWKWIPEHIKNLDNGAKGESRIKNWSKLNLDQKKSKWKPKPKKSSIDNTILFKPK